MKGIFKMLSGRGEKEYRRQHQAFRDAIPDTYPNHVTTENGDSVEVNPNISTILEERAKVHPAYSGPMAWTQDGYNYRAAHYQTGPQSKQEHAKFAEEQALLGEYERENHITPGTTWMGDRKFRHWKNEERRAAPKRKGILERIFGA